MDVSAIQSWYASTPYTKLVRQYSLYKVGTHYVWLYGTLIYVEQWSFGYV